MTALQVATALSVLCGLVGLLWAVDLARIEPVRGAALVVLVLASTVLAIASAREAFRGR
jgi:hypothetical protein